VLDEALTRCVPWELGGRTGARPPEVVAAALADWRPHSWGAGGDLSTWSAPAVGELAFAAREAELEVVRAGPGASTAAVRELLALQASDWAFLITRKLASSYARERFEGHRAGLASALAGEQREQRNLAVDAHVEMLLAP
jgi:1,4-alpha-glucan branching enzyme